MGQAKNRGSLQERIQQARARGAADDEIRMSIEDVIKRHELPSGSTLAGYVIHFNEKQFVSTLLRSPSKSVAGRTSDPEKAYFFEDYREATTISRELSGATGVAVVLNIGNGKLAVIFSYAD